MKTATFIYIPLLLCSIFFTHAEATAQPVNVNLSTFQENLSPYGRWMDDPHYGQVWVYNEPGFRPYYTNGHWELTDYGWSWASDYDWGWAPFHYGRWEYDALCGWMWIPGYEWAPAWVTWSQSGDYYGWAPLGFGIDINIAIGRIPSNRWMFAPRRYITNRRIDNYCVPFNRNSYYFRNNRAVGNIYTDRNRRYMYGPDRYEVERFTNSRIEPRRIDESIRYRNTAINRDRNGRYQQNNYPNSDVPSFNNDRPQENYDRRDNNLPRRQETYPQQNIPEGQQTGNRPWQRRNTMQQQVPTHNDNPFPNRQIEERNNNTGQSTNGNPRSERPGFPVQQQRTTEQRDNGPKGLGQRESGGRMQSNQRRF